MASAGPYWEKQVSGAAFIVNGPIGDELCAVPMQRAPLAGLASLPAPPETPARAAAK